MILGPTVASMLGALRADAESLQTDACTITHAGAGDGTFDETTGQTTPPAPTTVYAGACRLRVPMLADREQLSGEHQFTTQDAVLSLPMSATDVSVDDLVSITASTLDEDLVGCQFVVMAILHASQVTARRLVVREVTR